MCCITVFARTSVVLRLLWCSRGTHRAVLLPRSGVFGGGVRWCDWSDCEFLDNFCTVFVNFISRLNRKNPCSKVSAREKNCVKVHPKLSFWSSRVKSSREQEWFFFWRGAYLPPPHPTLTPTALRPLVTDIINTLLLPGRLFSRMFFLSLCLLA